MTDTELDGDRDRANVFVSYSRKDRDRAQLISDTLRSRHFGVFRDTEDILPTEEWKERLEQLIAEADTVVFLLSPHSAASEVCAWEVEHATSLNKRIAPIVIDEVDGEAIPPLLARLNFIFCTERDRFEDAVDSLVSALNTDIDWIREHTRLAGLAARWTAAGRPPRLLLRGQDIVDAEAWRDTHPAEAPQVTLRQAGFIAASRQAAVRRQRWWIGGSLTVTAATAALAVVAWLQSVEADRQRFEAETRRVEAERNYAAAKSAADDLLQDLASTLFEIPDIRQETLRAVYDKANAIYDDLLKSTDGDIDVLKSKGKALGSFALTFRDAQDREMAERASREAIKVFDRVIELDPDTPEWRERRALTRMILVAQYGIGGQARSDAAQEVLAQAEAEIDTLDNSGHRSDQLLVARSTIHLARGLSAAEAGDLPDAARQMRAGLDTLEGIDRSATGTDALNAATARQALLSNLPRLLEAVGDTDAAAEVTDRLIADLDQRLRVEPNRPDLRAALSEAFQSRSRLADDQDDPRAAWAARRQAMRAVYDAAPWHGDDPKELEDYAVKALQNGNAVIGRGEDPAKAGDWFLTAAALNEEMIRRGSDQLIDHYEFALSHAKAEETFPDDPDRRLDAMRETIAVTEGAIAAHPNLVFFQGLNYGRLGEFMVSRGDLDAASGAFEAAIAAFANGRAMTPDDAGLHLRLGSAQLSRGDLALRASDTPKALTYFRAGRDSFRAGAEIDPGIALDLAEAHVRLALAGDLPGENWRAAGEALASVPDARRTQRHGHLAARVTDALRARD